MLGARGRWEAIRVRLATWNVNSVKARLPRLLEWLDEAKPDIVCLQEIKCVDEAFPREAIEILRLLRRYNDTPMSFADACLVRMAELNDDAIIFTTDNDFRTYRKHGRQAIPLIIP